MKIQLKFEPWFHMLLASCISCVVSLGAIELIGYMQSYHNSEEYSVWLSFLAIALFFGSMGLWVIVLFTVITHAFVRATKKKALTDIGVAYLSTLLTFSGAFYMLGSFADHNHFVREVITFEQRPQKYKNNPYSYNERGFKGIKVSMFKGIESRVTSMDVLYGAPVTSSQLWEAAQNRRAGIPEFAPENTLQYFLDCFYLSVATITTIGYGDVTPNIGYTKIAAIIESLLGVALAALALGIFFNSRTYEQDKLNK